jgi:hydrogenase-4 component F
LSLSSGHLSGFAVDRIGALFALLTTFVAASSISHAKIFFKNEEAHAEDGFDDKVSLFYFCANLFLLAMTSVCLSDNLGYLWISIEGTTLASAPLVYFAQTKHALEATWKYLIICSVGIAFALFGTILIFAASQQGLAQNTLSISKLIETARGLDYPLLRLGFVFCLLGYGTKAGIFPLHSWLPDAHSEAPAPASAMLSGSLLNCALLAIWRLVSIVLASGHPALALTLPLAMGVTTVLAASFFLVRQSGLKRLWAYSSIENVGLMLSAIGLGSASLFFLLALNHSLAKVSIFLLSGNIIQSTGKYQIHDIKGILNASPVWAFLLTCSAFAVTGAPPFGAFIAEWALLAQSADTRLWWVVAILVFALALTFIVVCFHVGRCIWGNPSASTKVSNQFAGSIIPALLLFSTLAAGSTGITSYLVKLP